MGYILQVTDQQSGKHKCSQLTRKESINHRTQPPCSASSFSSLVSLHQLAPTILRPHPPAPVPTSLPIPASSYSSWEVAGVVVAGVACAESGAEVRCGGV